jgi:hypothetical protein
MKMEPMIVDVKLGEETREAIAVIDALAEKFKDNLMAQQRRRYNRMIVEVGAILWCVGFLVATWWLSR